MTILLKNGWHINRLGTTALLPLGRLSDLSSQRALSTSHNHFGGTNVKSCIGLGKIKHVFLPWPSSSSALRKAFANMVNMHFVNSVSVIVNSLKSTCQASPRFNNAQLSNSDSQTNLKFSFSAVTAAKVKSIISNLPRTGSMGCDGISINMLKYSATISPMS